MLSKEEIKQILLAHGFKIQAGESDLKNYVYDAAHALLKQQAARQNKKRHTQVGGSHYQKYQIEPKDFIIKNGLSWAAGNVIKYVVRYADKNGIEDLEKAKQNINFLICELQEKEAANAPPSNALNQLTDTEAEAAEQRQDVVGQNGNDGLHYEQSKIDSQLPEWVKSAVGTGDFPTHMKWLAVDANGCAHLFKTKPSSSRDYNYWVSNDAHTPKLVAKIAIPHRLSWRDMIYLLGFQGGKREPYTKSGKLCTTHKLPSLSRVDDAADTEEATAAIYSDFVAGLTKTGITFNNQETHLIHMIMGASGETGELLDAIKKHVIYKQELDLNNVIEELGDIEFYLEGLRAAVGITRAQTLSSNISKLLQRYPSGSYSDAAAQERQDKN